MISQGLEDFLTYLRETEQQMHMAAQSEQEANDATQDILHRLELCDIDGETAETLETPGSPAAGMVKLTWQWRICWATGKHGQKREGSGDKNGS